MKIKLFMGIILGLLFSNVQGQAQIATKGEKTLVVYFSYTGNTRALAQQIHEQIGGELVEIEPVTPYSKEYKKVEKQGYEEVNAGYQPPIKTKIKDIDTYDVIFVGSPIWWYTIAPPVSTFLAQHELSGKKVIPFVTHGGYGQGHSIDDIKKLCPKSTLLKEYEMEGKQVNELKSGTIRWLKNLNL